MSIFSCIGSAQNSFRDIIQTRSDKSFGTLKSKFNDEVFIVGGGSSKGPNKCLSRIEVNESDLNSLAKEGEDKFSYLTNRNKPIITAQFRGNIANAYK